MGIKGAFGGAFRRLNEGINGAVSSVAYVFVGKWIKGAAEGKHGPTAQKIYLALTGKKRAIGGALALAAAVLAAVGAPDAATWTTTALAGILIGGGLIDSKWREQPPWYEEFRGNPLYRWLAEHAMVTTAVLGTAAAWIQAGHCGGYDCAIATKVLAGVGAALVSLGLADMAWLTAPPLILPPKDDRE